MRQRPQVDKGGQLGAPDILEEIGLDGKGGKILEKEAKQDVDKKVIQDQAAKGFDHGAAGKKMRENVLQGDAEEEEAGEQIKEDESHEELQDDALTGIAAPPEGLPLMREKRKDHGRGFDEIKIKIIVRRTE